jgi:hypothetical protein
VYDDEDVVISSSHDDDIKVENIKKLKENLPLTHNDKKLYPEVRSLIEHGWFKKKHAIGFNKKLSL